ncbi:Inositol 2-dehydrogenase/D-chiro-inositol 3-dehydrogenase [Methylobacterium crusticola]|uniref:Inositol 2-dehydrogenase/D-chiro-inositol 3-dehydrogenase n=1 Tax=Methylobacterium crusticola TaxID=1697972 RepID=A0ABQ4R8Z4_9HYPH|nr:Gfo/Idh/MocA family oxidoreductase [Methylobacterium crusticola]GJD53365.1 Inositol 2-dehydrogenase/D-chiro-inositol 3-dehydrogenase [Methylobacterium crusticola]
MRTVDERLALGIIGAGIMGERMLNAVLGQDGAPVRVAAVWDPAPAALARMAAAFPAVPRVADAAAVVAASACVYVASPPASHLTHAHAAVTAGRSVFCEKPLAVDVAAARAFVAAAGVRGAVNFPFASSPGVAALAGWIAAGAVGRPQRLTVEVAFAAWPRPWQADAAGWLDARAEGGFVREVVSHFLFLSRRLLGPLHGLRARADFPVPGRSERSVEATLRAGEVPVRLTGHVGRTGLDDHNTWTLEGDAGTIRLRDWAVAERRLPDGRFEPAPDATPNEAARMVSLRRQLEGVARMTRGEPHHLATLAEALEVQEIVEGILAA